MKRFTDGVTELSQRVGHGPLVGRVEVNQVYARYQHEGLDFKHPQGGQAKYLEEPLYSNSGDYMRRLAKDTLDGDLTTSMAHNMEDLAGEVYKKAPFEFGDLKASPHPSVTSAGAVVYDRPPMIHRLSEEELRIKSHLRSLGF